MITVYFSLFIIIVALLIFLNRKRILWNDSILNPTQDSYLNFAEKERKSGKIFFNPWVTTDPILLSIVKNYFPDIALPFPNELVKPNLTPVKIEKGQPPMGSDSKKIDVVAVGGPPAAMVAYQQAKNGKQVLYVNNNDVLIENKKARPIWMGAANHGEPDVLTEAPAYITGNHPLKFLYKEFKRFIFPLRYDSGILQDNFPWLIFNIKEWLLHPLQWLTGLRVAFGNHLLFHHHKNTTDQQINLFQALHTRTKNSGDYLETFTKTQNKILRSPRGSLIVAPDQSTWNLLQVDVARLKSENKVLQSLTSEEAKTKYGIGIRNPFGLMEKTHDFIFAANFFQIILDSIKSAGGTVITNWRLERILISADTNEKWVEFSESLTTKEKKYHYRSFSKLHLSLGATTFKPTQYDLVNITGVSINALLIGAKLIGGPIVCGGVGNHVVFTPLTDPITLEIENPLTGKKEPKDITFIRIAVGGAVSPLNRNEKDWYTYYGPSAINALHCVRNTLSENVELKVLSVIGCNRVIGKDGRQVEITPKIKINKKMHSLEEITIQIGAGGGGLTQMGAIPMSFC